MALYSAACINLLPYSQDLTSYPKVYGYTGNCGSGFNVDTKNFNTGYTDLYPLATGYWGIQPVVASGVVVNGVSYTMGAWIRQTNSSLNVPVYLGRMDGITRNNGAYTPYTLTPGSNWYHCTHVFTQNGAAGCILALYGNWNKTNNPWVSVRGLYLVATNSLTSWNKVPILATGTANKTNAAMRARSHSIRMPGESWTAPRAVPYPSPTRSNANNPALFQDLRRNSNVFFSFRSS